MLKVLGIIVGIAVAFIVWRWMSVARGASRRDHKLISRIEPIGKRIDAGEPVSPEEIAVLASRPEIRHMLFSALRQMKKADLLPTSYSSSAAQGESALAYWMMHPNELQDAPEAIELVETIKRPVDGRDSDFHVYRYRMAAGHWAAKDGWILGVAGPMLLSDEPYSSMPGAFSRAGDIEGKTTPTELVDWYVGMLKQQGIIK
jgi:hypothetical protein